MRRFRAPSEALSAVLAEIIAPPQVNWRQILDDLRDHGCTGYRVTIEIGVAWSTVQGWRECKGDIGYGYGRALLRLHSKYCSAGMTLQRQYEAEKSA